MTDLNDLIQSVSEADYWTRLRAAYDSAKVAWRSWSPRNAFLGASRFTTDALFQLREGVKALARGQFLDYAGDYENPGAVTPALTLFMRSQYQLERQLAVFARGRVVLELSANVPAIALQAAQLQGGTPGPVTDASRIFFNVNAQTLRSGEKNIVLFDATGAGDSYNLPVGAAFELKTTLVGVTASLIASGEPTVIGTGNAALTWYAADSGVSVEYVNLGAAQTLDVSGNLGTKKVTVRLGTDGGGLVTSTAQQIRDKVAANIPLAPTAVGPLVLFCELAGDGSQIVQATTPVALEWTGTWLEAFGQPDEDDIGGRARSEKRFDTLGGGGGDGAPGSEAQTDYALEFWARQPPAGRKASPVTKVKVYSNMNDTGALDGAAVTIFIAGTAGALPGSDVTAVRGNFEKPQKVSFGTTLYLLSATNQIVVPVATINVKRSSGRTLEEIQQKVEASLTALQKGYDIGETVYPQKLAERMGAADTTAIRDVSLSFPMGPVSVDYNKVAVLDLTFLAYAFV